MTNKQYIFGHHAIQSLVQNQPDKIIRLCVQQDKHDKKLDALIAFAKQQHIPVDHVSRHELERMTDDANHQGIAALCERSKVYSEHDLQALLESLNVAPFILVLDGVQDPHNLGACFRSADAAGVHLIIAPKDKSVGLTPVVSKVASGAVETVPFVQVTNLVRTLEKLKSQGIWIYGADGEATQSLYQTDLSGPTAIVLGAEGAGLRRLTREHCDVLLSIPMQGSVASLNVSVATGVFLFEALRQRMGKK